MSASSTTSDTRAVRRAASASDRRFAVWLAVIAAVAFALRIVYVLTIAHHDPRGFGDPTYYHEQANLLAHGHGFSEPFTWLQDHRLIPAATHPPLFTVVLASSSVLGFTSYFAHKVVACLVGTATVVVVGLLGREIGGRRVGLIAAVIALAYPNLWVVDGILLPEGLFALTVALALLAAVRYRRSPRPVTAALVGVAIGLASLTRGEGIFLTFLLALPIALLARQVTFRTRLVQLVTMAVAVLVVLAPWMIRNSQVFQRSVLLSTNSGDVLAQANCDPTYHGNLLGFWYFPCESTGVRGDASVVSATQRDKGLRYIRHHLDRVPVVVAARVGRVWSVYRPAQGPHLDVIEGRNLRVSQAGLAAYWLLVPFAVAGVVILARRRSLALLPLLAPVAMVTLTAITTYGTTRFRAGAEVSIVVLATVAVDASVTALRHGRREPAGGDDPARAARADRPAVTGAA